MRRRRFAIAGVSSRGCYMYAIPLATDFQKTAELVAMFDPCQTHMDYTNSKLPYQVPTFRDFGQMVKHVAFDELIVVTKDSFHHEYIIRGLKAGKDVIVEKPMTIDDEKCRAILRTEKATGRKVTVTFNVRFTPEAETLYRVIQAGTIGKVVQVDMRWTLDQSHGADYFRRWHGHRANTNGLQLHKCTHHFDMVNWIIQGVPEAVTAQGGLAFYGKNGPFHGKRCTGCPHKDKCRFYWDLTANDPDHFVRDFYIKAEPETGYFRDGCVFDPAIDIEDHYCAMVRYEGGMKMAYSLEAFAPWEGCRLEIQGTRGRLEYLDAPPSLGDPNTRKVIVRLDDGSVQIITPPVATGSHGGGDPRLQQRLFEKGHPDPLHQMAGSLQAAHSILIGVAAVKSIHGNNEWIRIPDLLKGK